MSLGNREGEAGEEAEPEDLPDFLRTTTFCERQNCADRFSMPVCLFGQALLYGFMKKEI